jgi:flagellin-specific chaperone FliS
MLIDGALRRARAAIAAFDTGRIDEGKAAVGHCRDIVSELIAGISPEKSPVGGPVLAVYMYLLTTLVESHFTRDTQRLADAIRVLEEERVTWQAVCEQMPDHPAPVTMANTSEELAPQRVTDAWTPGYGVAAPHSRKSTASPLSLEA